MLTKPLTVMRICLPVLLLLTAMWTTSGFGQQEEVEEDIPITEQELLELEMEAAEEELMPPDDIPPDAPDPEMDIELPRSQPRPYRPQVQGTRGVSSLEPGLDENLGPGTIEVTDVRNVTYFDGQISVEFRKVPAGEALEEIGALAGFKVITDDAIKRRTLSVRFSGQPLEKGLTRIIRLLEAANYRYYYTDDGALDTVVVTATTQSIGDEPVRGPAATSPVSNPVRRPATPSVNRPSSSRRRLLRTPTR